MDIRKQLIEIADEWTNDWLTVERFARYHGLTLKQAETLIDVARDVRDSKHPDE